MKWLKSGVPLVIFAALFMLLWRSLSLHPNEIPSPLLNKKAPAFTLPSLLDPLRISTEKDFLGHVTLFNVWASWCYACAIETDTLMRIAQNKEIVLYGLNYKDEPANARRWLQHYGNPYQKIAVDQTGQTAIDWGVYGTPETFVIDKKGMIRLKIIGPITSNVWEQTLQPLVKQLQDEPG